MNKWRYVGDFIYGAKGNRKVSLSVPFNPTRTLHSSLSLFLIPILSLSFFSLFSLSLSLSLILSLSLSVIPSLLWIQTARQSSLTCPQSYLAINLDPHIDPPKMSLRFINHSLSLNDSKRLTKQPISTEIRVGWWKCTEPKKRNFQRNET